MGAMSGSVPPPIPPEEREPSRMWPADFDATTERPADYYRLPSPGNGYAQWATRVLAALLDWVVMVVPVLIGQSVLVFSGGRFGSADLSDASAFGISAYLIGVLATFGLWIYNVVVRQGRTGQTWAKSWVAIKLVGEADAAPFGPGRSFLRQVAHILDALPCYLGYLWPLWDSKRQTFADKIMTTVVVRV